VVADPAFVLVLSPLVGPSSWGPAAQELREREHQAVVPSLVDALSSLAGTITGRSLRLFTRQCPMMLASRSCSLSTVAPASWSRRPSGAPFPVAAVMFVDTSLPHPGRSWLESVPAGLAEQVDRLVEPDGRLRPWHEWFLPGTLEDLIPTQAARSALFSDIPRVPLSYLEQPAPVLDAWRDRSCGYLRLSCAYESPAGMPDTGDGRSRSMMGITSAL
jgi:hypothetical protein